MKRTRQMGQDRIRDIKRAENAAAMRQKRRDEARAFAASSGNHRDRLALQLAEAGFGVMTVMERTGVNASVARGLVLGED